MKDIKILGIGIAITLLLTSFAMAEQTTIDTKGIKEEASLDAGVPIWEVGDSWTYKTDYWEGDTQGNPLQSFYGEVTLEVVDDTGDSYLLAGEGKITYDKLEYYEEPLDIIPLTGTAGAELEIRKDDLGLMSWHQYGSVIGFLVLNGIPLPIPVQMSSEKTTIFDPTWVITPFPLVDDDTGVFNSVMFHEDWEVSLFWGLIPLNIGNNSWGYGEGVDYTVTKETITCESGGYTAYNISGDYTILFMHDYFRTYFVEEVGNTARENIHIEYRNTNVYLDFNMELVSTTYEA